MLCIWLIIVAKNLFNIQGMIKMWKQLLKKIFLTGKNGKPEFITIITLLEILCYTCKTRNSWKNVDNILQRLFVKYKLETKTNWSFILFLFFLCRYANTKEITGPDKRDPISPYSSRWTFCSEQRMCPN